MSDYASTKGAENQMAKYDQYTQQALGGSPAEAMQKAQAAAAQQAQGVSDQAVQQSIKAGKTAGAMGGQAALAATGQAANAYGQAQQAGQQQYFNTAQLGAQLGSEMSGRLQKREGDLTQRYGIQTGAETSKYATDKADQQAYEAGQLQKQGQWIGMIAPTLGAIGGIAGVAAGSDKRQKEDIKPVNITKGLSDIKAYTYKYKKGPWNEGDKEQAGIMAQDLEKTAMAPAVIETPDGKMIDTKKLTTMNTGALAEQEKRMKRIENILKGLANVKRPEAKK